MNRKAKGILFTSDFMRKAWAIRKAAAKKFNCSPLDIDWRECLIIAQEMTNAIYRKLVRTDSQRIPVESPNGQIMDIECNGEMSNTNGFVRTCKIYQVTGKKRKMLQKRTLSQWDCLTLSEFFLLREPTEETTQTKLLL